MANILGELMVRLGIDMDQFTRGINDAQQRIGEIGKTMGKVGKGMVSAGSTLTKGVTLPLVGIGVASIKTAMDFEAGMSEVKAISGATGKEFDDLTKLAIDMGAKTKFSAKESSEALKYMAMAGWDTQQMMDGLPGVLNLAAASGEDLALVSDIVTDAMTAFGMEAKEAGKFSDLLASTASNSNTNIAMLGESLKYAAPVTGALGYSAEHTMKALGLMANAGIKASQSGTAIRAGLTNLVKPSKEASAAMEKYGINIKNSDGSMKSLDQVMVHLRDRLGGLDGDQKAAAVSAIFGKNAMSGWLAVINASEKDFKKLGKATTEYNGIAEKMANEMLNNLTGQITLLKSALSTLAIQIGNILIPFLKKFTGILQSIVVSLSNLSPATQKLVILFGLVAASIGPILVVIGKFLIFGAKIAAIIKVITFASVILAAKILLIGAAVGIIIAIFLKLLQLKFGSLGNAFAVIASKVKEFGYSIKDAFRFISDGFKGIGNPEALIGEKWKFFWNLGKKVREVADIVIPFFKKIGDTLINTLGNIDFSGLKTALNNLVDNFKNLFVAIQPILKILGVALLIAIGLVVAAIPALVQIMTMAITIFIEVGNIISSFITLVIALFTGDFSTIKNSIKNIWESIKNIFMQVTVGLIGIVFTFVNTIIGFFTGNFNVLPTSIGGILSAIGNIFKSVLDWIVNTVIIFGSFLQNTWLSIWEIIKTETSNFLNWVKEGFASFGTWISTTWNNMWNGVKNIFTSIVNGIVETFTWLKDTAIAIINGFVNLVINAFLWLYNHNYYFEALVNFIVEQFNRAKTFITAVWNAIKTVLINVWNGIKNVATTIFNSIKTFITTIFNSIKTFITTVWNGIKTGLSSIWNSIKSVATNVFNSVKNVVTQIFNSVKSTITNIWNSIKNVISNVVNSVKTVVTNAFNSVKNAITSKLNEAKSSVSKIFNSIKKIITDIISQAYKWGANLIGNLIKGIGSKAGALKDSVANTAKSITKFLGFHSPTEEGAGKDADKWAPNLIKMYVDGIYKNIGKVRSAAQNMSQTLKDELNNISSLKEFEIFAKIVTNKIPENLGILKEKSNAFNNLQDDVSNKKFESNKINNLNITITGNSIAKNIDIETIANKLVTKLKSVGVK